MLDLDDLEALEQAATSGEWSASGSTRLGYEGIVVADDMPEDFADEICSSLDFSDAEFIAAIRNAAPELIAAARERDKYWDATCAYAADVSRLERENNELQARIDAALACYGPDPSKRLGESRWRSADEFLIAIRTALTTPTKEQKA